MTWSPTARDEYCVDYALEGGAKSFATFIPYDAYTIQIIIIALVSTICNVGVLYIHWTIPPHPKFLLLLKRKISIRLHVLSGSIEILVFVVAFFAATEEASHKALVYINAAAAAVHCLTALYQTPIVFGTQAVMLPAYSACVLLKIACVFDLIAHPNCALKFLRLYNIHSIYTWCRVFIALFTKFNIMTENLYTVSIMLAGFCCAPAYGPAMNVIMALVIVVYTVLLRAYASPETVALQMTENARDMFDNPRFQSAISGVSGKAGASSCPFGHLGSAGREDMLKVLFASMDKSGNGRVDLEEIEAFAASHKSQMWTKLIAAYKARNPAQRGEGMDYETFKRVIATKGLMDMGIDDASVAVRERLLRAVSKQAKYHEQARFIFDAINRGQAGNRLSLAHYDTIALDELAYLLIQYSLPLDDVEKIVHKFDSVRKDGRLSFSEFKRGLGPLVKFQIKELRNRIKEIESYKKRTQLIKEYTKKEAALFSSRQVAPAPDVATAAAAAGLA